MWYPDQRDIKNDKVEEVEDQQKTYDTEKQFEDDETSDSDYKYTDWASI